MGTPIITVGTPPSSGTVSIATEAWGRTGMYKTVISLNKARVPTVDAGASGSYGTLPLATLIPGAQYVESAFQKYTSFAEGSALTTGAGNAAFVIGVGSAAIAAAADKVLATANQDIISALTLTNSGGTSAGSAGMIGTKFADGSSTPNTWSLNLSVSAATSNASSYLDVTGTICILWSNLGVY